MDDDWNDGQMYTLKLKNKGNGFDMTNTAKVSHPNGGSNKFAAESKIKVNLDVFGGIQNEVKFKNNGEVSYEFESDALKTYHDIKGAQIVSKGTYGANGTD